MLTAKFPDLLDHMDKLIGLPSVSSANAAIDMSNSAVIDYLANCFSELGFEIELVPSPGPSNPSTTPAATGRWKSWRPRLGIT